jgi:glycosyltransferase involved in cell wall biosynthesis
VRLRSILKNLLVVPKSLWLARVAKRWGADHIHAQWAATTATMALIAGEWSAILWSFTAHSGDILEEDLLRVKTARASLVRFISQTSMRMAVDRGAELAGNRARVIHMGVVLPRCIPVTRDASARFEIFCPASLLPVKGHQYLLHAMALVKKEQIPFRLRLAGGGPLKSALEEMARQLSLTSDVEFLGPLPHERLLELYRDRHVDAVVLPSIQLPNNEHEGIPVSLMEAMAYGVPVISTRTGGIPELLQDGAGIMVPPQDVASLAAAVERLFRNPSLREGLAAAGRRRIEREFSVDRTVEQLAACIEAANARSQAA